MAWGFSTRLDAEPPPERRLHQIHGCRIVEDDGRVHEADGIVTTQRGRRIGVRVADCVPILLAGLLPGERPWVAALHAGWRGAVAGILREGAAVFRAQGGRTSDLAWSLGPAILACHFEVGPEVVEAARGDRAWADSMASVGPRGRPHLDLHAFLRGQALDEGFDPGRECSVPLCTFCRGDLFHSHRRGDPGRQWGWVEIL
ncbi:MAG: polyphenol oxidase family protein [Acidobacteria bacterium]|nr:polyphenol oxidase family protein [Acidobacteriota bacterium]